VPSVPEVIIEIPSPFRFIDSHASYGVPRQSIPLENEDYARRAYSVNCFPKKIIREIAE
jgi:hypothetical protein